MLLSRELQIASIGPLTGSSGSILHGLAFPMKLLRVTSTAKSLLHLLLVMACMDASRWCHLDWRHRRLMAYDSSMTSMYSSHVWSASSWRRCALSESTSPMSHGVCSKSASDTAALKATRLGAATSWWRSLSLYGWPCSSPSSSLMERLVATHTVCTILASFDRLGTNRLWCVVLSILRESHRDSFIRVCESEASCTIHCILS